MISADIDTKRMKAAGGEACGEPMMEHSTFIVQ